MAKARNWMIAVICGLAVQGAAAEQTYTATLGSVHFITSVYPSVTLVQVISHHETLGELVLSPAAPLQHAVLRLGTTDLKIDGFYAADMTVADRSQASVNVDYQIGRDPRFRQGEIARWNLVS